MSEIQEIAQHIQDFPALVRKARMDKGITNEELTELSGISYSAVCKMQSGERDPKLYDAVAVMKAVGISADQTFEIQPLRPPPPPCGNASTSWNWITPSAPATWYA